MLNPQTATITEVPATATQFRLQYHRSGAVIAELVVDANPVDENEYAQSLAGLNALVPAQFQGGDIALSASAINVAGESAQTGCLTTIQVINPPAAPSSVVVS